MQDKRSISEISRLVEIKEPVKRVQAEVAELIAPHLMDMDGSKGDRFLFSPGHYSGAGKKDLEVYSRGMFSHMVGGDVEFFEAGLFDNEEIMRDKASQLYFEKIRLQILSEMYSNGWYDAVKPALEGAGALGTDVTTIMSDYDTGQINVMHWHPGDVFIGENGSNRIDRLALKVRMSPSDLVETSVDVPESIIMAARQPKQARKKLELWGYFRKLSFQDAQLTGMNWIYRLLGKDGYIYDESYMHTLPGPIWRLEPLARSAYGLGMGIKLYRDLLQSNKIQKLLMQESELRVNPPMWIPNTASQDVYMTPGSLNYTSAADGSQVPRRMMDPADMGPASQLKMEIDALAKIHFYSDFFMQLTGSTNRKTTAEVQGLMMESGAQVTSLVDSFERNYLMPSVRRHFILMSEQGRLAEPSSKILRFIKSNKGAQMGIKFIGPLAQARRWMFSVGKDMDMIEKVVVPLANIDPGALDYLDYAELFARGRQFMSGGRSAVFTQDEVDQIRKDRADAQAQADQQAYQFEMMKMTKAPEQGSPAEAVMSGQ